MMGKDERFSQMTPQQIESFIDKSDIYNQWVSSFISEERARGSKSRDEKSFLYLLRTRMRANETLIFSDGNKIQGIRVAIIMMTSAPSFRHYLL